MRRRDFIGSALSVLSLGLLGRGAAALPPQVAPLPSAEVPDLVALASQDYAAKYGPPDPDRFEVVWSDEPWEPDPFERLIEASGGDPELLEELLREHNAGLLGRR